MAKSIKWAALSLMFCVAPASAQDKPVTIGVGYQSLWFGDVSFPVGGTVDVAVSGTEALAAVGEIGWARNSRRQFGLQDRTTVFHVAGGGRWTIGRMQRFRPFGQLLVGWQRDVVRIEKFGSDAESAFLLQPGGGVILKMSRWPEVFGQLDWQRVFKSDDDHSAARFLGGLRFRLG